MIGASLLAIVVGISSGNTAGWSSVRVLGVLVVCALLLVVFLRREQRVAASMTCILRVGGNIVQSVFAGVVPTLIQDPKAPCDIPTYFYVTLKSKSRVCMKDCHLK